MTVYLSISGKTVSTADATDAGDPGRHRRGRRAPDAGAAGAPWHEAGRSLQEQQVNALTREPTHGLLFAGTQDAGLHVSADDGRTWERRDSGIEQARVWTVNYTQAGGQVKLTLA